MLDQLMQLFPGMSLRPALACEISPYGVFAARRGNAGNLSSQFVPIPAGALQPGLEAPNLLERAPLAAAMRTALGAVTERKARQLAANRALTLIVPDGTVRVLLLDFDSLPSKRGEALAILRFRLRRLVPFDVENAAVSWQVMSTGPEGVRVLVLVMPRPVLAEYEGLVREAGYLPGVVLPSTVAAAPLVGLDPALVVNRNGSTLTTAILRGPELLLHRTLDFRDDVPADAPPRLPPSMEARSSEEAEDIRQSVSVALAYFEDTLKATPSELFYIGPGNAKDFESLLGEPVITVRNLAADSQDLPSPIAARSLIAPVAGALLNA